MRASTLPASGSMRSSPSRYRAFDLIQGERNIR